MGSDIWFGIVCVLAEISDFYCVCLGIVYKFVIVCVGAVMTG